MAAQLQSWWDLAAGWLPPWMAPNVVTLIGFGFVVASYLTSAYYSPYLIEESPSIVYLFHMICVVAYQTLDALDGKQARRTKSASPLGELFDHGCDAIATTLIAITCLSSIQAGAGWTTYLIILFANILFFFAQWQQYNIGELTLGYVNVTEAQFAVMAIHFITALFGPQFWSNPVPIFGISWRSSIYLMQFFGVIITLFINFRDVAEDAAKKRKETIFIYLQLTAPMCSVILLSLWALVSPKKILYTHPHGFFLLIGFLYANLAGRIVFARMCEAEFSWKQFMVYPAALGFFNASFFHE
eukprot:TRINITY_DN5592_c0_g1_i3.p1 TRINITY_DN5592_c0_g1~~TRINITY_DN5592_c0_g1_i3.p1  ORF type:complete len:329 (-),score=87.68 TRINITY_DN5592_c0_g1_i3:214-1113(-)